MNYKEDTESVETIYDEARDMADKQGGGSDSQLYDNNTPAQSRSGESFVSETPVYAEM